MDEKMRKEKIEEIKRDQNNIVMTGAPLTYKGEQRAENVYKIPLDFLVYNKYNGRIGSDVLSYEKQNGELNIENEHDIKIIENFLYNSKKDRNDATMRDLLKRGQQKFGIVTADGVIVDGNRRALLLNRLFHDREKNHYSYEEVDKCRFFNAIILPDDAEEKDIQQLETIYQMGEDEKLDYNPIEKYLKCKQLQTLGFSEEDIAGFMGENKNTIKKWLDILELMDEYLDEYDYDGIYTRLEKTEGPLNDLYGYLNHYQKRDGYSNVDWDYADEDISDLKTVCFDYIRARYEGKDFRNIATTGKDGSIFSYKDLWDSFLQEHTEKTSVEETSVEELREDNPGEDLSKLLKSRDDDWTKKVMGPLTENLKHYTSRLEDKRDANKPAELISKALNALDSVDMDQEAFYSDSEVLEMLKNINSLCWDMQKEIKRRNKGA